MNQIIVKFSKTILVKSGVDVYNMSWTPGNSFAVLESIMILSVVACDLDVYLVHRNGDRTLLCMVTCPSIHMAEQVYNQEPHGPGSCDLTRSTLSFVRTIDLQFVHRKASRIKTQSNLSILWDEININFETFLFWSIPGKTSCSSSMKDNNYSCISNHSQCMVPPYLPGYVCRCSRGFEGNPYLLDGCSPDIDNGTPSESQEPKLYVDPLESASVRWAVANLTCQDARDNTSGYACVSTDSSCPGVISSIEGYVGYRCVCLPGFEGNPYIPDGCIDIDDCAQTPGLCKGICQNTIGNYSCTKCPDHTEYDITKMQCTPKAKQNLFLGIIIGLSTGFGLLLLSLSAVLLVRRWKRDAEKKLRRKYFRMNQGLLLEQLISSDENASEKTKIFSLEELSKATNNFDTARILGHGGHGTVYKGILSNQHVVAIKKVQVRQER